MAGTRPWQARAACAGRTDLDWFDIDCNLEACLNVCSTCSVAGECLTLGIELAVDYGVWGGEWGYRLQQIIRGGTHAREE